MHENQQKGLPGLPAALKQAGWKTPELARRMGVCTETVRRWQRGDRSATADILRELVKIFRSVNVDTTASDLLGDAPSERGAA